MAQSEWNEEMSEGPFLLQEDLTCPVCKELYLEPVLLSCSHSFCKGCLAQSWKVQGQKCPVCRKSCKGEQPISNRALMGACESFQKEKNWRQPYAISNVPLCNLHRLEFQLYCMKDEEPVCVECVTLHQTHELMPLRKGAPYCKEELTFKINILEEKVETFKKMKNKYSNTVDFIKSQALQAEKQIKAEFERLHQVLHAEEIARLKALADEEEDKKICMEENINSLSQEITTLTELIQTVKREMGAEDLTFLQNFKVLKRKAQWLHEDPQNPSDALLNMAKHVGSLGYSIWKSMQAHVTCIPVVMDPNTASPWLSLSPDLASVRDSPERQSLPDNPERFDPCVFVLGAEGFSSGKHRWEVHVGDNPKWILGVCKESVARKRKFTVSTDRGVWTIGLSKGIYNALTARRTVLAVESRPERVRVKLNMEKGEISFWDAGNGGRHLCTFTHEFKERLFPIFGPGLHSTPMEVYPAKVTIHTA
ncbi:tripartite motif containing 35-28 [Esox lucius]|uniref:Tripartite motif containing 35-28 n=1 Tax=Esox lucius TaxID=8010 RepID=A0A3P9AEE0_ESOLU|nr:tripartite motif containing 35-28 [Esox lucius]